MTESRLARSTTALYRTAQQVMDFCGLNNIKYTNHFKDLVLPPDVDPDMRRKFNATYKLTPLLPTTLQEKGASTMLIFESRHKTPLHGEVEGAIARTVGRSLNPDVDVLFIEASLNPNFRKNMEPGRVDEKAIRELIENQGVPVLMTSIGWGDIDFNFGGNHDEQEKHFWNTTAFVVDSAGNEGILDPNLAHPIPFQKHNALSHFAPLAVRVGACAMDNDEPGSPWSIEGYSSANGPTFLAPVASRTKIVWNKDLGPEAITGTSVAAPYAASAIAALNGRFGAYLTREQMLYALIATCKPVTHVNAFTDANGKKKTPEAHHIEYMKNAAGLAFNPGYGGFGRLDMHAAELLLAQMVALTQKNPERFTTPTEDQITLVGDQCDVEKSRNDGLYHYKIAMPAGLALKTTLEVDYEDRFNHGAISITSPSGTKVPMVMSKLETKAIPYAVSTTHGFTGESLGGEWEIASATPLTKIRLSQHHLLEKDIIQDLTPEKVQELLAAQTPDLSNAKTLEQLRPDMFTRVLHATDVPTPEQLHEIAIGGAPLIDGDVGDIINQLSALPPGFSARTRKPQPPVPVFDKNSKGSALEDEATKMFLELKADTPDADTVREKIAGIQISAADAYAQTDQPLLQIVPLRNAGINYLQASYPVKGQAFDKNTAIRRTEQAIAACHRALRVSQEAGAHHLPLTIIGNLHDALCRGCELGMEEKYANMLDTIRQDTLRYSREDQGELDHTVQRVEQGGYGYSSQEKIGTDHIMQSMALIVQNPVTRKTGIAHVDIENDLSKLDDFFAGFGDERLQIRIVGPRLFNDAVSINTVDRMMKYLAHKNVDVISAAVVGGADGVSTVVVDPATFTLEEAVPAKHSANENINHILNLLAIDGKPLLQQFDLSKNADVAPIHLNNRMLTELRTHYLNRKEWQAEAHMKSQGIYNRPLLLAHLNEFEAAYDKEWKPLTDALRAQCDRHDIGPAQRSDALRALHKQSIYIGENATEANRPVLDWINNALFKNGELQRGELEKGPTAHVNIHDPVVAGGYQDKAQLTAPASAART